MTEQPINQIENAIEKISNGYDKISNFFDGMPASDKAKYALQVTSFLSDIGKIITIGKQIELVQKNSETYIANIRAEGEQYRGDIKAKSEFLCNIVKVRSQEYRETLSSHMSELRKNLDLICEKIKNIGDDLPKEIKMELLNEMVNVMKLLSDFSKFKPPTFENMDFNLPNPPQYASNRNSHSTKQKYAQTVDVDADEI